MEPRKRRSFTREYKGEMVAAWKRSGKSIGLFSKEVGLTETSLRAWAKQAEIDAGKGPPGAMTTEERQENTRLRRELKQMTMERDFLRKAAAFFARGGK